MASKKDDEPVRYAKYDNYYDSTDSGADKSFMSEEDYNTLQGYKDAWAAADKAGDEAGKQAAHDAAEALRKGYGYSGGANGGAYNPILKDTEYGGVSENGKFSYASAPNYTSRYQNQIDELTKAILNREAFSYDPETDPTYQQYKEAYTRDGQRAMQDTLGQVSARTGGLASSYAGSAAQQTYDNYMAAQEDKIPELRQLAYTMYQDEGDTQRANLEMLMALDQGDYAKYADLLSQWNTDRSFDYGVYRDNISDQRYDTEWNYQVGRDQIADQRYDTEWNYQVGRDQIADQRYEDETEWERSQYASETEYNQALAKAQTLAAAGDFSGYKALGYTDAEIANLKTAYNKAQAAARSSGGSGGSSDGNKWAAVEDWVARFGEDAAEDYIKENYKALGYSSQSAALSGWKNHLLESGSGSGGDSYSLEDLNIGAVLQLGIGPVSYQTVEDLVEQGKVDVYTDSNGKLSVRWADGWNAKNYKNRSGFGLPGLPGLTNPLGR